MGALRRLDNLVTINEDASDAPLNDDVLRQIAGSGGARQPEADEASVASRATSAHTVIPTPHGRARMAARAVSVKELQTAKKYGTITRARDDPRDGTARYKIEHDGIVYITDRTQKRVITTYHQTPVEPEAKDAQIRRLDGRVREMERRLSEGDALRDALQAKVDFLVCAGFELEKAHERRLSERESERDALQARVDALVSELEEARDLVNPLTLTVNALQTKIDELHALACQVDSDAADAIKNRSNSASGSPPQVSAVSDKDLECPLTYELFEDPVTLEGDGIVYERGAIEQWLRRGHMTSPVTGLPLGAGQTRLIPNEAVRARAQAARLRSSPSSLPSQANTTGIVVGARHRLRQSSATKSKL